MQTLWSRVAQAQSTCRCRVCLHPPNALARRATTAAPRRKVTAADLFTACYTTILGSAVVIDSKRKEVRRKELDAKLERARASLSSLAVQEAPALLENEGVRASLNHADTIGTQDIQAKNYETRDLSAFLDDLAQLAITACMPRSRSAMLRHEVDWEQVEAAISFEEKDDEVLIRHPRDQSQLERTTRTVESLVQTLLWRVRNANHAVQPTSNISQGDQLLEEAEELVSDYPSYSSPHLEPEVASDARGYLSETFRSIFSKATNAKEVVGKICYNLLLSNHPPNIHNYNTLIAGFNRIQRPDLAEAVIDSYLGDTRWPATQQTIVCLLNHARGTNDFDLFRETVGRMKGTVEDGMHLRIFDREAIYDEAGFAWVRQHATNRKYAYVQRAQRGHEVFNSLIRGWLHFGKVEIATMSFVACVRNQFLVPVETIHELLTECVTALDSKNARKLLDRLSRDFQKLEALLDHIVAESSAQMANEIGEMFCALFDLCGYTYNSVLSGSRKSLSQLLETFRAHVSLAVQPSGEASFNPFKDGTNTDLRSIARIAGLAKDCQNLEEKTQRLEAHAKVLILKHTTGCDLNASGQLPPIDWQDRGRQHYPALFYALQAIDLTSDITTQSRIKTQLLHGLPDQNMARKLSAAANLDYLSFQSLISFYHPCQKKVNNPVGTSNSVVERLEKQAAEIEDNIRAILFCHSSSSRQKKYRAFYHDWQSMPVEKLFQHTGQVLEHQLRLQQTRKGIEACSMDQSVSNEIAREVDSSADGSPKVLPWADGDSPQNRHVDISLAIARSATAVFPVSKRQVWSDEHVGLARYQPAEAAASC